MKRFDAIKTRFQPFMSWVRRRVPRGLRLVLGIVLVTGGFLGFLPILGFWMIPLGIMVAALDVNLFRRWRKSRQNRDNP